MSLINGTGLGGNKMRIGLDFEISLRLHQARMSHFGNMCSSRYNIATMLRSVGFYKMDTNSGNRDLMRKIIGSFAITKREWTFTPHQRCWVMPIVQISGLGLELISFQGKWGSCVRCGPWRQRSGRLPLVRRHLSRRSGPPLFRKSLLNGVVNGYGKIFGGAVTQTGWWS